MRAFLVAVLVTGALVGLPSRADAACAMRTGASPNDVPIPLRGSVYAYVDSYRPMPTEIEWTVGTGTTQTTQLLGGITRVDYVGSDGAALKVNGTSYRLARNPAIPRVPRLVSIVRHKGAWTCSSYDNLSIELDGSSAAVHARWTRDGATSDYWVVASGNRIELGARNCGSTTLPPSELDHGGELALFAVFPDGSEHLIAKQTVYLLPDITMIEAVGGLGKKGGSDGETWQVLLAWLAAGLLVLGVRWLAPAPATGTRRSDL